MISFCINVRNRSKVELEIGKTRYLFPNCLDSLTKSWSKLPRDFHHSIEVIIVDWNSTDWPLKNWVPSKLEKIDHKIIQLNHEKYHNGKGRNMAANNALGNILFFLDADMLINKNIIEKGVKIVEQENAAYLPISFYFINSFNTKGFWCAGKGNCMISKKMFKKTGGWPEPPEYTKSFDEDQFFSKKLLASNIPIIRSREQDFWHQYHPGKSVNSVQKNTQKHFIIETKDIYNDKELGINFRWKG